MKIGQLLDLLFAHVMKLLLFARIITLQLVSYRNRDAELLKESAPSIFAKRWTEDTANDAKKPFSNRKSRRGYG